MTSPALEGLVGQDTCREVLGCMTFQELIVAYLRMQGLYDAEIAELMQVSRVTVATHMHRARARIVEMMPELAVTMRGRHRMRGLGSLRAGQG
jgi:predicted DNA-binding protein (UPF0251 family)